MSIFQKMTLIITCLMLSANLNLFSQANSVQIEDNIRLPKDSLLTNKLISSLNSFLQAKDNTNSENSFVLPEYLIESSALLDELKDIDKSKKYEDDNFYKCYLSNLIKLNDSIYKIQISYIGLHQNDAKHRASFSLMAIESSEQFYFYSPLSVSTSAWNTKVISNYTFRYKNNFDLSVAESYVAKIREFDKRLKIPLIETEFYCAENLNEVLTILGVDYKSDYNGYPFYQLYAIESNKKLIIDGYLASNYRKFDPHDLWHSRVLNVLKREQINKPVDEGCAYLYGGSWGYSWETIRSRFKEFVNNNKNANWLNLYNESKNYGNEKKKPLRIDYTINALLVKKIEDEKGFDYVMKLLSCGKKEKDNKNYFTALESILGINQENFNSEITKLLRELE